MLNQNPLQPKSVISSYGSVSVSERERERDRETASNGRQRRATNDNIEQHATTASNKRRRGVTNDGASSKQWRRVSDRLTPAPKRHFQCDSFSADLNYKSLYIDSQKKVFHLWLLFQKLLVTWKTRVRVYMISLNQGIGTLLSKLMPVHCFGDATSSPKQKKK
ncbi:unnamed protein product [Camellia sinensis]